MDSQQLGLALRRQGLLDEDLVGRIVEEKFNQSSFVRLTAPVLRALGFLGSEMVLILQAIQGFNDNPDVLTDKSKDDVFNDDDNSNDGERYYGTSDDGESEIEKALNEFMSEDDMKDRSIYDKKILYTQLRNWKDAQDQVGDPKIVVALKPKFVVEFEARKQTKKSKRKSFGIDLAEESGPNKARRISGTSNYAKTVVSVEPDQLNSSVEKEPGLRSDEEDDNLSFISSPGSPTGPSSSCSASQSRNFNTTVEWKQRKLPEFNVKSVLEKGLPKLGSRGKTILKLISVGNPLKNPDRKLIVRMLTKWMYRRHVSDPKHVDSDMKEGLAKSLHVAYPAFFTFSQRKKGDENIAPWANLFNRSRNTGWIVNAARPIQAQNRTRRSNLDHKKESLISRSGSDLTPDQIDALGLIIPSSRAQIKKEILEGMARSFKQRKQERREGKTIKFFLQKYIHFTSYGGEVICEEFLRMHPDSEDMMSNFQSMKAKLIALGEVRPLNLKCDNYVMKCLLIISQHLPHDIPRRKERAADSSWAVEDDLMAVLKPSDDIEDFATDRIMQATRSIQPYLVLIRTELLDKRIVKYFLVLDGKPMELTYINTSSPHAALQAFDVLMKTYCVFNVEHPFGWRNTLHFIQHYLYGVEEKVSVSARGKKSVANPSQVDLWTKLQKS